MNSYKYIFNSKNKNFFISIFLLIKLFFFRKRNFLDKKYNKKFLIEFDKLKNTESEFSSDWFSYNIKYLVRIFYRYNLIDKDLRMLEIGSYEGRSTIFFLNVLKKSKIQCVDLFEPGEELKNKDFGKLYENFIKNISPYKDRVNVFKGISDDFFKQNKLNQVYDLIYIDGNHSYNYVLRDAENSFKALKKGGIMIFDDFLWQHYNQINENPIGAIKEFIANNFFKIKIISISYQIALMKL